MNKQETKYCNNCSSTLGIDCGEAEPDFNDNYCSKWCFLESHHKLKEGLRDIRSQLIDGGSKEDSVLIRSLDILIEKNTKD